MLDIQLRARLRSIAHRHAWWIITAVVYCLVMTGTAAQFMADTIDYSGSIEAAVRGEPGTLWEFGHLWWRPLGYVTYRATAPLFRQLAASGPQTGMVGVLLAWNWLAGLAGALALNRFVSRVGAKPWGVVAVTLAYLITFGVLNYAHSGSSYVPGLACLLVALALLAGRDPISAGTAIAAGTALVGAVGFWALYILVIPAVLAFPLVWHGLDRRRLWSASLVTFSFVLLLVAAYLLAILQLGIHDLAGLRAWVTESSHDIVNIRGGSRVVFGVPRSFISMGKDGILFKRFLLRDPYHPVTLADLIRGSLLKVGLFYVALFATFVGLLRGKLNRRLLVLAILGGVPLMAFAVGWQGGDVERYMPIYPFIFAAWALVLGGERPMRFVQAAVVLFIVVMGAVNLPALSRATADRDRDHLGRRVEGVLASLSPLDRIYVVLIQDPLFSVKRDPLSACTRDLKVGVLVPVGYASTPNWRSNFAKAVFRVWAGGGKVWISKRAFSQRPKAEWDWVEGDERSVSWSDVRSFFKAFELGDDLGDDDGFVLLARTPRNEQLLERSAAPLPANPSRPREKKAA